MPNFEERRAHQRVEQSEAIALKIVFTSDNPRQLGKTLAGTTIDVSASGIRLAMQDPLAVDSTIDVEVTLRRDFKKYYLSAKVRWCRQIEGGSYQIGIALQELHDTPTDYRIWQQALQS